MLNTVVPDAIMHVEIIFLGLKWKRQKLKAPSSQMDQYAVLAYDNILDCV